MRFKRILLRSLVTLFGISVVLYAAVIGFFIYSEPSLLYAPVRAVEPAADGVPFEAVTIAADDGVRLGGWVIPPDSTGASNGYWILFLHGNYGNVAGPVIWYRFFRKHGFHVLAIDYRGFGTSAGTPSEQGLYLDARGAYDYLVHTRGVPADRVIVYGHSLGAAVAIDLATVRRPAGLIVEDGMISIAARGQEIYPFLPVSLISRQRFDAASRIPRAACPKLFFCANNDKIVPRHHSERLFALARPPKRWVLVNGGHNDAIRKDENTFANAIEAFVRELAEADPHGLESHLSPEAHYR
jgi:fermentation-respiration switch protein FrsA (DUF1100 family)